MGYYINSINGEAAPPKGKVDFILARAYDSQLLPQPPTEWQEGLVCVVDNGAFEAAAYTYDEGEMNVFLAPDMGPQRPRQWLLVPEAKALSGYKH